VIIGHYAAALLPYRRLQGRAPLWLLLLCAQVPEFLWLLLALAGVEPTEPRSILDATFSNLKVDMRYSHDLLPTLGQAVTVAALVFAVWRKADVALVCGGLTLFHSLCDYGVGFEHHLNGPGTMNVALNSYGRFPHLAIAIELAFALTMVWLFRGSRRLYVVFAAGILVWLPAATVPLGKFLALHE
jgi:hypothetical protein